ncbi:MAG: polysaccharide biosynthesis/export family protein [Verrucomicrobiales bacterium]|nr:polysaccharide biosynthesis/export family protein [Verrucomicrobiales bacterium]
MKSFGDRLVFALTFLAGFCLLGCHSGTAQETPAKDPEKNATPIVRSSEPRANLLLKPGDIISVNVFGEPSLTGAFPVGPGGDIVFPLLGGIPASGVTAENLGSDIKTRLEADYIRSAQVSVAITQEAALAPNSVTVIGQVMRPGQVGFEQGVNMDLFTAIATAGGLTERADRYRIELKRRDGGNLRTQVLSLEGDRVMKLEDKDTLIVFALPEKVIAEEIVNTVTVIGEVKTPGQVPMKKDHPLDIITAIAMAGGFTDVARPSRVFIRRSVDGEVKTFELNVSKMQKDNSAPFLLVPNDTVTVPQSVF